MCVTTGEMIEYASFSEFCNHLHLLSSYLPEWVLVEMTFPIVVKRSQQISGYYRRNHPKSPTFFEAATQKNRSVKDRKTHSRRSGATISLTQIIRPMSLPCRFSRCDTGRPVSRSRGSNPPAERVPACYAPRNPQRRYTPPREARPRSD